MSELENRYSALFGSKTSKGQLQSGFFLMAVGALFGLAALSLFVFALFNSGDKATYYNWMKAGLTTAPVALAGLFMGWSLTLPTRTGARVASWVGLTFTLVAALLFFLHYPANFNVAARSANLPAAQRPADYMGFDVLIAVIGFVAMAASVVTSIVGYYLGRVGAATGEGKEAEEDVYGSGYEVPDWVVERDIEDAMKRHGVQWGEGIRDAHKNTLYVNVADSMGGGNMVVGGLGKARTVQVESTQVDEATAKLSGTRGHKKGALPGEWADESVAALVAFRRQKAANPTVYAPKRTFWQKVGDFFTGRGRRVAPAPAPKVELSHKAGKVNHSPASLPRRGTTVVIHDDEAEPSHKAKKGHK
ncbi:MAG: hypothetical protein LC620_06075 [Halobacteriales archaeon]|nr:hypothetical protein [Halobacteriales archaeon]